jgi:hypothetical protein
MRGAEAFAANVSAEQLAIICRRCRKRLDMQGAGQWVATFPNRAVRGYHLPKLVVPGVRLGHGRRRRLHTRAQRGDRGGPRRAQRPPHLRRRSGGRSGGTPLEQLCALMGRYSVAMACIDGAPERRFSEAFAAAFAGRVFLAGYYKQSVRAVT